MRELFFECPLLLLALIILKAKTFVLRLENSLLRFERFILLLERRELLRRQSKALTQNGCRPVLGNKPLDVLDDSHLVTPNAELRRERSESP